MEAIQATKLLFGLQLMAASASRLLISSSFSQKQEPTKLMLWPEKRKEAEIGKEVMEEALVICICLVLSLLFLPYDLTDGFICFADLSVANFLVLLLDFLCGFLLSARYMYPAFLQEDIVLFLPVVKEMTDDVSNWPRSRLGTHGRRQAALPIPSLRGSCPPLASRSSSSWAFIGHEDLHVPDPRRAAGWVRACASARRSR
jgi:hypothetical protein